MKRNTYLHHVATFAVLLAAPALAQAHPGHSAFDFTAGVPHAGHAPEWGAFSVRYVNRYSFQSGVNWGVIPGFGTFNLTASYKLPSSNGKLFVSAQNLFSCVGGTTTPPATGIASSQKAVYTVKQQCGFGQTHQEMLNMPAIGPIIFVGVRYEGR